MLQSLDTLIAFVVIITGASTFVTVIVQMVSAALSLRGKNLANALALTLQTVDPEIGAKVHGLAAHLLSDPLLSDSTSPDKDRGDGKPLAGLSDRKQSWSMWNPGWIGRATRLANAARPEEIYSLIQKFANRGAGLENGANERVASPATTTVPAPQTDGAPQTAPATRTEELQELALGVLHALGAPAQKVDDLRTSIDAAATVVTSVLPEEARKAAAAALDAAAQAAEGVAGHALDSVATARWQFDHWFGIAQDRAQQWFQLQTRIITIIISALVALFLQLDAIDMYQTVNRAATSHDILAKSAEQVSAIAARDHALLPTLLTKWHLKHPKDDIHDWKDIKTADDLERALAALPANTGRDIHAEFSALTKDEIPAYYKDQRADIDALDKAIGLTGYEIFPPKGGRWPAHFRDHLFGIFATIALLTLGAPYWYNLLKNLTSLRPALAQIISKEDAAQTQASAQTQPKGNPPQA